MMHIKMIVICMSIWWSLLFHVQMFIVDNTSMRDKCGNAVGQCCKDGSYQYREIETELKEDPSWPPVSCKSIDLATVFQRLENLSHTSTTQQYEVWSSLWIIVLFIAVPFLSSKKKSTSVSILWPFKKWCHKILFLKWVFIKISRN